LKAPFECWTLLEFRPLLPLDFDILGFANSPIDSPSLQSGLAEEAKMSAIEFESVGWVVLLVRGQDSASFVELESCGQVIPQPSHSIVVRTPRLRRRIHPALPNHQSIANSAALALA